MRVVMKAVIVQFKLGRSGVVCFPEAVSECIEIHLARQHSFGQHEPAMTVPTSSTYLVHDAADHVIEDLGADCTSSCEHRRKFAPKIPG